MDIVIEDDYIVFKIKNNDPENNLLKFYTPNYFTFIGLHPEIYIPDNIPPNNNNIEKVGGYFQNENLLTVPYKYFVYLVEKNPLSTIIKKIPFPKYSYVKPNVIQKESTPPPTPIQISIKNKEPINSNYIQTLFKETQNKVKELTQYKTIEPIVESTRVEPTIVEPIKESTIVEPIKESTIVEPTKEDTIVEPTKEDTIVEPTKESTIVPIVESNDEIILKFLKTEDTPLNGMNLRNIISSRDPTEIDKNINGLTYQEILNIKIIEDYFSLKKIVIFEEEFFYINGKWIIIKSNIVGKIPINIDISQMENTELTKRHKKCVL